MIYHGIDLVDIDRITQAIARWGEHFLQRVFTAREIADAGGRHASLAARFAAKEATAKALGIGLRGPGGARPGRPAPAGWREIEVVRGASGQPSLRLHGRAAKRAAELGWHSTALSLSHARHSAIASVVAVAEPSDPTVVEYEAEAGGAGGDDRSHGGTNATT
jgi:holo-[acyl-carrier protein] synthase